jgi:hypothetical protein
MSAIPVFWMDGMFPEHFAQEGDLNCAIYVAKLKYLKDVIYDKREG